MAKLSKKIAILLALAMIVWTFGPALAIATDDNISTSLVRGNGGGSDPIVKVKWEMNAPYGELKGTDDLPAAGAQFMAPGAWDGEMNYSVCAIVTDPNGVDDIDGVYADIYYPATKAFHYDYPAVTTYNGKDMVEDLINGGTGTKPDYGLHGCGEFIEENTLLPLTKDDGIALFCDTIRSSNNNLPTFFSGYDYDEICGATGELEKETAYVYCDDKSLIWEDPAGDYKVEIFAQDQAGNFSYTTTPDYNYFEYLPLTAFETDFSEVDYGEVLLNTHKRISGDLTWDDGSGANPASVRNVGNTRLYVNVEQDDMGLGQTSSDWNVRYDARVGNEEADWKNYWPETNKKLQDILDLSEVEEMDFSILVTKWPNPGPDFTGNMWLSASGANFRECIVD